MKEKFKKFFAPTKFKRLFDIVDTELLAVKYNELFIPAALEIFDRFQIFFQFISNGGLGCTLTVLFMGFSNIPAKN